MKKLIFFFLLSLLSYCSFSQSIDKEVVALQMNSCVMSITNLNQSQSLSTYDNERNNLLNNLSKEGMTKLPEVAKMREDILGTIYQLKISEEERDVLKRIRTMEKNSAKWQAISGALSSAMVFVPGKGGAGPQAAFYALMTAARSAVEYGALQSAGSIEEERQLWEIRKKDLEQYAQLNTGAYRSINSIFNKYKLTDGYELTPEKAEEFIKIIQEKNARKLKEVLLNNENSYKYLNDYYYYLGMAHYELKEFGSAEKCFAKYLSNEQRAKIHKRDAKTGCIYLARLGYSKGLTKSQYEDYINKAIANLPNCGHAYVQCALIYFTYLQSPEKAVSLLSKALYNDNVSDKEAVIIALTKWMPKVKKMKIYPTLYQQVCNAIEQNEEYVSVNNYLSFLNACGESNMWKEIGKLVSISGHKDSLEVHPTRTFDLHLYKNLYVNTGNISVFTESISDDELLVAEKKIGYPKGYTKEKLKKKLDLFAEYEELIYSFFDYDGASKQFYVKRSLKKDDFDQLKKTPAEFEALRDYSTKLELTDDGSKGRKMVKKLVEFCEDHQNESPSHRILVCNNDGKREKVEKKCLYLDNYFREITPIKTINLKDLNLNSKEYTRYIYSEKVHLIDGSKYRSRMWTTYQGDFVKIQFLGKSKETESIYITYQVVGGKARIVSFQVGNVIRYNKQIKTKKPEIALHKDDVGIVDKAKEAASKRYDKIKKKITK